MEYQIYKFYPGQKIITDFHCEYSSEVVAIVPEVQKNGYVMNLIIYKDWNKYKKYYDYHCEREIPLSVRMKLIKEKIEDTEDQEYIDSCKQFNLKIPKIPKSYKKIIKLYKIDRIEKYK